MLISKDYIILLIMKLQAFDYKINHLIMGFNKLDKT